MRCAGLTCLYCALSFESDKPFYLDASAPISTSIVSPFAVMLAAHMGSRTSLQDPLGPPLIAHVASRCRFHG
eukprot:2956744-Pyramimonas_sp.AAC.2